MPKIRVELPQGLKESDITISAVDFKKEFRVGGFIKPNTKIKISVPEQYIFTVHGADEKEDKTYITSQTKLMTICCEEKKLEESPEDITEEILHTEPIVETASTATEKEELTSVDYEEEKVEDSFDFIEKASDEEVVAVTNDVEEDDSEKKIDSEAQQIRYVFSYWS